MEMKNFIAKYIQNGIEKVISFDASKFDKERAEKLLAANNIQNFFFFFEPQEFLDLPDGSLMVSGEIGFDITLDRLKPFIDEGRSIVTDSAGGNIWEALKIRDYITVFAPNLSIGTMGLNASANTIIMSAAKEPWASENSRHLIHNPTVEAWGDADELMLISRILKMEEDNIISIYANQTGKSYEEIKAKMKPEKIMTSKEALDFGIIKKIKRTGESTTVDEPVTINNNENEKKEEMEKAEAKKALNVLAKAFNDIKSFFGPSNLVLQDVNGVELDFGPDVTSEEQIVVGITGVTANGQPAEGDYVMPDGRTMKFTGGALNEIAMPEDNQVEQLTAENTALKEEVANLKKENGILAQKNTEAFAKIKNIETEFNKFKNEFSQEDKIENDAPPAGGKNYGKSKFSYKPKKQ